MNFDQTKITSISINLNKTVWNPDTHNILLTKDTKTALGFTVKMIEITDDRALADLTLANDVLKKFRVSE